MSSTREQARAIAYLTDLVQRLADAEASVDDLREKRDDAIAWCAEAGVAGQKIATLAGVSAARVSQIAPKNPRKTDDSPEKNTGDARVSDEIDTLDIQLMLDFDGPRVSDRETVRVRNRIFSRRDTTVVKPMMELADLTRAASAGNWGNAESIRVFLTGPQIDYGQGPTENARRWVYGPLADGWRLSGAYLPPGELPTVRLRDALGRELVVMRAGSWFGSYGETWTPDAIQAAWDDLSRAIAAAFPGGQLADSPATTGRALWLRTIGPQTSYPVASDEIRQLIHATTGQGRVEFVGSSRPTIEGFSQYDGRLMYAAHTWGLGIGEPRLFTQKTAEDLTRDTLRGRGWLHVTVRVPDDWQHVGMLPLRSDDGWVYPATPGTRFHTWCEASEAWTAREHGWDVRVVEGISWREGKPLNGWRDKLVGIWRDTDNSAVRAAIRSILLFSIGAFASQAHPVTKSTSIDTPERVSEHALPGTITTTDDQIFWQEPGTVSDWSANQAHPEWAATIWGRTRARMAAAAALEQPGTVLGIATDAIYLARSTATAIPADDGKIGTLRLKGFLQGPMDAPGRWADLHALRDQGETYLQLVGETP